MIEMVDNGAGGPFLANLISRLGSADDAGDLSGDD